MGIPMRIKLSDHFTYGKLLRFTLPSIAMMVFTSIYGVDEKGVEAATYTMVAMDECAMMPEELPEIDFFLTRPFLYAIEANDGTVLFIGSVTAPDTGE